MLLSICIPTHDGRDWALKEAVESVVSQVAGRHEGVVEICVSDNGSRDQTQAILSEFRKDRPEIFRLHRFEENRGGHNNFLKVVEIATGDYCWLLGSDDTLMPGAVDAGLGFISDYPSVSGITFGWRTFDRAMSEEMPSWFATFLPMHDGEMLYTDPRKALEVVGLYLIYMSSHIFRRSDWQSVLARDGVEHVLKHRHYMHAYILARSVMSGSSWLLSSRSLVNYRYDNVSLLEELHGKVATVRTETAEDFERLCRHVAGPDRRLYRALMYKRFRNWYSPAYIADLKRSPGYGDADDFRMLATMTRIHWYLPEYWLRAVPHLLIPNRLHKWRVKLGLGAKLRKLLSAFRGG